MSRALLTRRDRPARALVSGLLVLFCGGLLLPGFPIVLARSAFELFDSSRTGFLRSSVASCLESSTSDAAGRRQERYR